MMKFLVIGFAVVAALLQKPDFKANGISKNKDVSQSIDTILLGDINGDKKKDTAFVVGPKMQGATDTDDGDCVNGDCSVTIRFSGRLPEIRLQSAIGAKIENIGDANGDHICEIVVVVVHQLLGKDAFLYAEKK